uniref:Uncharacterized protein n=1 Tax=Anguilla anguilla TaxID=7936 RepID=A0A0E9SQ70_ANGAN
MDDCILIHILVMLGHFISLERISWNEINVLSVLFNKSQIHF